MRCRRLFPAQSSEQTLDDPEVYSFRSVVNFLYIYEGVLTLYLRFFDIKSCPMCTQLSLAIHSGMHLNKLCPNPCVPIAFTKVEQDLASCHS